MNLTHSQPLHPASENQLEELLTQQQLYVAVYQALTKALPNTTSQLEIVALDLAQQLSGLTALVARQQELLRRIISEASTHPLTQQAADELRLEAGLTHELISRTSNAMGLKLQFQDHHRQSMKDVLTMLEQCLPSNAALGAQPSMAGRHNMVTKARRLVSRLVLPDIRQLVTEVFEYTRVLPRNSRSSSTDTETLL